MTDYNPERRLTVRRWMVIAAQPVKLEGRVHSDELGSVSIPERECPDTGEYESDCDCTYHAPRDSERCAVTGVDVDECGCPAHRDHPDL